MRFKKFTFNWLSVMIGFHYGRNPVSNTRFLHVALVPFIGMDFYWPDDYPHLSHKCLKTELEAGRSERI